MNTTQKAQSVEALADELAAAHKLPPVLALAAAKDWIAHLPRMPAFWKLNGEEREAARNVYMNGWIRGHFSVTVAAFAQN